MKTNICLFLAVAGSLLWSHDAEAGEAAFSGDGKFVYCLKPRSAKVLKIAVPAKPGDEPEVFDLSKTAGEKTPVTGIVAGKDGAFLLTAGGSLLTLKPGGEAEKTGAAPLEHSLRNLAVHPVTGHLLAPALTEIRDQQTSVLLTRDPGEKDLRGTESMPREMTAPVFDGAGRLFFGVAGCLCAGGVMKNDDGTSSMVTWPVGPLDAPGLDNGTSSDSQSITGIAPAGKWLYLTMTSDVDCGLIRLPLPDMKVKAGFLSATPPSTRKARWKRFSATLNAVENLESETQPYFSALRGLCASPDGKTVFFAGVPTLHPEREEYWTINVKTGEKFPQGSMPLEE